MKNCDFPELCKRLPEDIPMSPKAYVGYGINIYIYTVMMGYPRCQYVGSVVIYHSIGMDAWDIGILHLAFHNKWDS